MSLFKRQLTSSLSHGSSPNGSSSSPNRGRVTCGHFLLGLGPPSLCPNFALSLCFILLCLFSSVPGAGLTTTSGVRDSRGETTGVHTNTNVNVNLNNAPVHGQGHSYNHNHHHHHHQNHHHNVQSHVHGHGHGHGQTGSSSVPIPIPSQSHSQSASSNQTQSAGHTGGVPNPYIEPFKLNTTAFTGQTAYLPCVVKNLGDKTVSWIRRSDLHILTSGNHIYTSDPRVSLLRQGKLYNSWTLKITTVRTEDQGPYECQVNTEPKLTATLYLTVFGSLSDDSKMKAAGWRMIDSNSNPNSNSPLQLDSNFEARPKVTEAKILGPLDVAVEEGTTGLNFSCVITHPGLSSPLVVWFFNDIPVKESSILRGGINIETEKSLFSISSRLVIVRVELRHAGKYSCGGPTVYAASATLRVAPSQHKTLSSSAAGVNEPRPMISIAPQLSFGIGIGIGDRLDQLLLLIFIAWVTSESFPGFQLQQINLISIYWTLSPAFLMAITNIALTLPKI